MAHAVRRPHDTTDLYLAPVTLAVDERLERLAALSAQELADEISLTTNLDPRSALERERAAVITATYPIDLQMKRLVTGATQGENGSLTGGRSGWLVASTIEYSYKPVLGMVFPNALNLQSEALFLPRFGQALAAPNGNCPT